MENVRSLVRHVILGALSSGWSAAGRIGLGLSKPRVHFVYSHYVLPQEVPCFRALLTTLAEQHTFLSHSDAVQRVLTGSIDRPYISLSFDDGLRNCLDVAEVLDDFGIRACFFVPTGMVGEHDEQKIESFCRERIFVPPMPFLSWDDCEALLARGHEIGSHTVSHANMGQLSNQQLDDEIGDSYAALMARLGSARHFAWPYGTFRHFSSHAASRVFAAGFISCSSAVRGCHVTGNAKDPSSVCVRREHVIGGWPVRHSVYFLARSAMAAGPRDDGWPSEWGADTIGAGI